MHTARLLPVCPSMHCSGVYLVLGGYLLGGCTWSRGGCTWSWEVYLPGGVPARGVYLPGGCTWPGGICPGTSPPCGQNSWHTLLKILPCPKLRLRAVTKQNALHKFVDCFSMTRAAPWCAGMRTSGFWLELSRPDMAARGQNFQASTHVSPRSMIG